MKRIVSPGSQGVIDRVFVRDTSNQTKVIGLTGLTPATANLTWYYMRDDLSAPVAVTLVAMTLPTWVSGGFVEIDAVHMPGEYAVGIPNAEFLAGTKATSNRLRGAVNMEEVPWQYETDIDYAVETVIRGTVGNVTTPTMTQFTPSALDIAVSDVNQLVGRVLLFRNKTATAGLRGQGSPILAVTGAALPLITLRDALTRAPAVGDIFQIL